jgi:hypothetical protein
VKNEDTCKGPFTKDVSYEGEGEARGSLILRFKVNLFHEICDKCFAFHILKFEILQNT